MRAFSIGFNNFVAYENIDAIINYENAPTKRMVRELRDKYKIIDCTMGRKTKSVVIMKSGQIILSSKELKTLKKNYDEVI